MTKSSTRNSKMIVFIDESGDAGFKIHRGSSLHFVITLIIFDEELDAEETALNIKKLRKGLKKSERFEFKFNKCNYEIRRLFLKEVASYKFKIRAIVLNKEIIRSPIFHTNREVFYNFALRKVLEHNNYSIRDAKVRLDGKGERSFRQQLSLYLRKYLNTDSKKIMKNIRFRDSGKDVLIQLADMCAGALRRYYDKDTKDWETYWEIIKSKCEDIWEFK